MRKRAFCLVALALASGASVAEITLRHALTGEALDLTVAKDFKQPSPAVQQFLNTGQNPYNCDTKKIEEGHNLFLTACSGCHGHEAEGKLGPALKDDYWTYPAGASDKGLFEILFGGASGQMGPQYLSLTMDDMLKVMAYLRSIYQGDPRKAKWQACATSEGDKR
nr:cytochrome c [uncultured Gammaproteobacteria bacterium]